MTKKIKAVKLKPVNNVAETSKIKLKPLAHQVKIICDNWAFLNDIMRVGTPFVG